MSVNPLDRGFSPTVSVSALVAYLSQFPGDMPVTVLAPEGFGASEWLNVSYASGDAGSDDTSVVLCTADDFDTRQW